MGCTSSSPSSGIAAWEQTIRKGNVSELLQLLDRGFDVNQVGSNGMRPLHLACERNQLVIFEFLMHHKANSLLQDNDGNCPLHYAAFCGSEIMAGQLVDMESSVLNLANNRGQTALHWAVYRNHVTLVDYLCRKGAEQLVDDMGKTPRDYATDDAMHKVFDLHEQTESRTVQRAPINMEAALRTHLVGIVEIGSTPATPFLRSTPATVSLTSSSNSTAGLSALVNDVTVVTGSGAVAAAIQEQLPETDIVPNSLDQIVPQFSTAPAITV
eukprot:TRINITY_DN10736_c0_g1_i1.p1 TRINITY_DN10736_c0_g1~~TRINITY_DN10736_c0_g1_i1.p1  ORF type:complete len:269 (+),score=29.16 TRINITY_DN10736_c0_g1_i1:60-866(+)